MAADGTLTHISNYCFGDGTKSLETDTYAPGASTPTETIQLLRNGALCSTDYANTSNGTDASGHRFSIFTEVVDDPDGNLLATIVTTTTEVDRGVSHTEIVTCPGQPPEVVVPACSYGGVITNCLTATCTLASP
jgi:hypothetical protein